MSAGFSGEGIFEFVLKLGYFCVEAEIAGVLVGAMEILPVLG
jgi:hypothetical protein